ncbi:MAG TPA: hypothetical protein VGO06_11135 [Bosea sp. (in: a-proteobacteria)]|jgi:hypothetical protein|uniref:hypothetical protein n=1 Tax=Bosea sp. (in: a-proteobacteria) TaxID=1871050 RepID=UPI002E10E12F|nr:hypothetical protein [Bosea sp. (in: a-proteobacteria)]
MPKLSEIELGPNDILIPDIDDALIADFRRRAELMGRSVSDYILDIIARGAALPREHFAGAYVIVLDDEP